MTGPDDLPVPPADGEPVEGADEVLRPAVDLGLRAAVLELEQHASTQGWDQPARLYALVPTADLLASEPALADVLGLSPDADISGTLTPIEQEELPAGTPVEEVLSQVMWPDEVFGTAVVVERLVLPPSVGELPEDASAAQELAQTHPERQEVRMIAGATRAGGSYCALRLRSHDDDFAVIEGPDLVPALLELLHATLQG